MLAHIPANSFHSVHSIVSSVKWRLCSQMLLLQLLMDISRKAKTMLGTNSNRNQELKLRKKNQDNKSVIISKVEF